MLFLLFVVTGCKKDKITELSDLEKYVTSYSSLEKDFLIACAAGTNTTFMGSSETPIAIFYYKKDGVSDIQLFETTDAAYTDFSKYKRANLTNVNMFNGRMGRFLSPAFTSSKWFIVTYVTSNKLHVSDPIQIKSASYPTVDITNQIAITENGVTPSFDWQTDNVSGNVIYFSLVSDLQENFISGTYTAIKNWTYYDLTNVTLNVTPTENPSLLPDTSYNYVNMGVDEENWVRSFGSKMFMTN